jgi:uncharacterized membrane protein YkvA (DUF1232 family)
VHSLREVAHRVGQELSYYRCLIAHPRCPKPAKLLLGIAVAYFVSPIDIIPDMIPVLGQLDDLLVVPGLIWAAVRLVPPDVAAECRAITTDSIDSPR